MSVAGKKKTITVSPARRCANCRTEAVEEVSLTTDTACHRRALQPGGPDVPPLILVFAFPGKRESDERIANRVITRVAATQAVTICGDGAIRHVSTERVEDELASLNEVGYGTRRRPTGIGNIGGGIERKQHLACLCVNGIKFSVALAKENQIPGYQHTRFRGVRDAGLPDKFTPPRVGRSV